MSPRAFIAWAVLTLATLVAAIAVTLAQPETAKVQLATESAFPELRAAPDAASRVSIRTNEDAFTLQRRDGGAWVLSEKFGYPVDETRLRELIAGLTDMRLAEAMTARPERFARLQVEDVEGTGAKSRFLRIEAADGRVLAEAIIGKSKSRYTAGSEGGTYLRRSGELQSWLASGRVELEAKPTAWLRKDLVNVSAEQVRQIEIAAPEAAVQVLAKDAPDQPYRLENLPEGRELMASEAERLAGALSFLTLEDVRPAAELASAGPRHRISLTSFDGLRVTAEVAEEGDDSWVTFTAEALAGTDAEEPAKATERAQEISERVGGWAYKLPDLATDRLTTEIEQLLTEPGGTSR